MAAFLAVLASAGGLGAETFVSRGVEFSDELGGFRLLGVTGQGTKYDPFIVAEEMLGPGTAVLVIRGLGGLTHQGFTTPAQGFRIRKVVLNGTGRAWRQFDLELREILDEPSSYADGLSFDQVQIVERPFTSDRFIFSNELREPYDGVQFSGGVVPAGDVVSFNFAITDPTPIPEFYLMQTASGPVAAIPGVPDLQVARVRQHTDVEVPPGSRPGTR
ncbi:MAG: hypothetical protein RIC16_08265 [Rhodospirillales bacterium]